MVLRYHKWLPLELEPDYHEGYTCDHCHKEFLGAPFYHEEATGTDYCIKCGAAAGYTPFSGLVGSLLFSSSGEVRRDAATLAIALFAYMLDTHTIGIFFADTTNLILHLQLDGSMRDALVYVIKGDAIDSKLRLSVADIRSRFPWLPAHVSDAFDIQIELHPLPTIPVPLENLCVIGYAADDAYICIRYTDAFSQAFYVSDGRELIAKSNMPVCAFSAGAVDECTQREAKERFTVAWRATGELLSKK